MRSCVYSRARNASGRPGLPGTSSRHHRADGHWRCADPRICTRTPPLAGIISKQWHGTTARRRSIPLPEGPVVRSRLHRDQAARRATASGRFPHKLCSRLNATALSLLEWSCSSRHRAAKVWGNCALLAPANLTSLPARADPQSTNGDVVMTAYEWRSSRRYAAFGRRPHNQTLGPMS